MSYLDEKIFGVGTPLANATTGTIDNVITTDANSVPVGAIRFSGVAPTVTGLQPTRRPLLVLATGGAVILANENAGSVATNRIVTGTGANVTIANGAAALLVYDTTSTRWRIAGGGAGGGGSTPTGTGLPKIVAGVQDAAASLIVNADVGAAAAIAGTKIAPDFGAQNIVTTGYLGVGSPRAAAGDIRGPSGLTIKYVVGGVDRALIEGTSGAVCIIGDPTNGGAIINRAPAGQLFHVQINGANQAIVAESLVTLSVPLAIGAAPFSSAGSIRLPYSGAARVIVGSRDSAGTGDWSILETNGTTTYLGIAGGAAYIRGDKIDLVPSGASSGVEITCAGGYNTLFDATAQYCSLPILGRAVSSSPYSVHGTVISSMTDAAYTVPAAEYMYSQIEVPAALTLTVDRNFLLPTPATEAGSYRVSVSNQSTGGFALLVKRADGAGDSYTVNAAARARLRVRPGGVYLD